MTDHALILDRASVSATRNISDSDLRDLEQKMPGMMYLYGGILGGCAVRDLKLVNIETSILQLEVTRKGSSRGCGERGDVFTFIPHPNLKGVVDRLTSKLH